MCVYPLLVLNVHTKCITTIHFICVFACDRSSTGKHDSDKVEGLEADAGTMMDITDADGKLKPGNEADSKGGKKKKKGKKSKIPKADKALVGFISAYLTCLLYGVDVFSFVLNTLYLE